MSPRRYTARTTRPQAVKPAVRPGGGQAGCEIARLRGLQHKQTSPERRVQHTLKVAPERRPATGGPVSGSTERASDHVPGEQRSKQQHEPAHRAA